MGLRKEKTDKVKKIVILEEQLMITMDDETNFTYVVERNTNVNHHQAWIMNIIACAESIVSEIRDEQEVVMKRMSQLYADEDHYEWASELNNRGDEDWVDGEMRDNDSSDGEGHYGEYDDDHDEYEY
jgi:hypothetical protein